MIILMFFGVLLANQLIGILYKTFSDSPIRDNKTAPIFMSVWTGLLGLVSIIASVVANCTFTFSTITWLTAVPSGVFFAVAGLMYISALSRGSFIWSVFLMNLSNFIPIVFSLAFLGEPINLPQIIGVLMILSILFVMSIGLQYKNNLFSARWMMFAMTAMLSNGSVLSLQKTHAHFARGYELEFLTVLFLSASVTALTYHMFVIKKVIMPMRSLLPISFGMVATIGAINFLSMLLMRHVTAAVQFPIIVGGGTIITAVIGVVLYKENPSSRLYISAFLLVAGVILLGL